MVLLSPDGPSYDGPSYDGPSYDGPSYDGPSYGGPQLRRRVNDPHVLAVFFGRGTKLM